MIKLKDILLEAPNADTAFGKHAFTGLPKQPFAPYSLSNKISRDDANKIYKQLRLLQNGEEEPNTASEEKILKLLSTWTDESDPITAELLYSKFGLFKKAREKFPRVFGTGLQDGTPVFRGLTSAPMNLRMMLDPILVGGKTKRSDWKKSAMPALHGNKDLIFYSKPIVYKPHLDIQSWSYSSITAAQFVGSASGMLCTRLDNEHFLFNPDVINIIYNKGSVNTGGFEREVIHFGKRYKNEIFFCMTQKQFDWLNNDGEIENLTPMTFEDE